MKPLDKLNFEEGEIILIDKPKDWTSFDVVKKIRYTTRQKKVGHAGTLDPLATGLLIIAIGPATKSINDLLIMDKSYTGIIEIGKTTPSYDLETEFNSESPTDHISVADIENVLQKFKGEIEQVPPVYSAIKHKGSRAYEKARKGESIELKSRKVLISHFALPEINLPEIYFEVTCSKGTYIRSLAHDFGRELGTGAYLKKLTRTAIGNYRLEDAWQLDEFVNYFKKI
jgi:tRNA pseudouridine55 synthase